MGWTGGRFLGGFRSNIELIIASLDTVGGDWAECYFGVGSRRHSVAHLLAVMVSRRVIIRNGSRRFGLALHCPLTDSLESVGGDFVEFTPAFRGLTYWLQWLVGVSS